MNLLFVWILVKSGEARFLPEKKKSGSQLPLCPTAHPRYKVKTTAVKMCPVSAIVTGNRQNSTTATGGTEIDKCSYLCC